MTVDRSARSCQHEHHSTNRSTVPSQLVRRRKTRQQTNRGLSTVVAGPALTVLLHKTQGASGWVQKAMPSSSWMFGGGTEQRQLVRTRGPSCKPHDATAAVVSTMSSMEARRRHLGNAATHRRRYFQPPCGVFRNGMALDAAGNAVEAPGETPQVAKPLRSTGDFPATTANSSRNSNLAGRAPASAGLRAAAGAGGGEDLMGGRVGKDNGSAAQRTGKVERAIGAVLPLDPVVNEIKWWGRHGMWQKAEEALEKAGRAGDAPNIGAYQAAIFAMGYSAKWQKALSLLDEMAAKGIEPDERCYVEAIKACGKAGKFDETMGLLDAMVKNGSPPSLAIFKVVLESCVIQKKADKVPGVLAKMRLWGVQPNDETDRLAMSAVVVGRDWSQISATWKALTKGGKSVRGLKPKELLMIAKAVGGLGDWKMVLRVFGVSAPERRAGLSTLTLESFNYIVTAHACLGDGAGVLSAIKEMEASGHRAGACRAQFSPVASKQQR